MNGRIIKLMEGVNSGMLTEMYLKVNGKTIKLMDKVHMSTSMVLNTKVIQVYVNRFKSISIFLFKKHKTLT